MKIFNRIKSALKRAIGAFTPQIVAFTLQMLTLIGWVVCITNRSAVGVDSPEWGHWNDATFVHLYISWLFTFAVVILGVTHWGRTKFKHYYAED